MAKIDCENCGCAERIANNEKSLNAVCKEVKMVNRRVNGMIMRLNVMLGMIAVAVIMFLVDILLK